MAGSQPDPLELTPEERTRFMQWLTTMERVKEQLSSVGEQSLTPPQQRELRVQASSCRVVHAMLALDEEMTYRGDG